MKFSLAIITLLVSINASAFNLDAELAPLVKKVKGCVVKQMGDSALLSPEFKEMMANGLVDSMYEELIKSLTVSPTDIPPEFQADTKACIGSVMPVSCDILLSEQVNTKPCQTLQDKAQKYQK